MLAPARWADRASEGLQSKEFQHLGKPCKLCLPGTRILFSKRDMCSRGLLISRYSRLQLCRIHATCRCPDVFQGMLYEPRGCDNSA